MAQLDIIIKAIDKSSDVIDGIGGKLNTMAGVAGNVAMAVGVGTVAAIGSITAAVGVGVGKAMDLEQGIADIASVMGVTFEEAQPLGDLITNLGMDPKLKVDAMGAADAIMQLAQSGMSMSQIMDGAARSTVLLSNATGGDMAMSAAIASDAMSLFGIQAADMASAVNGIAGVTVASKFGIQDYQLALAQAGGVASAVGVNFQDFNTTIAAISPYFASGSDAGTSFKTFLQRLVPSTAGATEAMQQLGLITADGSNQFFTASGEMKSMSEIAGILATATAGMSEEQKNATMTTIFGSDAMRAAFAISQAGAAGFDQYAASIAKVDAESMAATRMDTLAGQMEILMGVIDGLLTQIGQAFLPTLKDLATWAADFASQNGPAIVAWFEQLAAWIVSITPIVVEWSKVLFDALAELGNWLQGHQESFDSMQRLWNQLVAVFNQAIAAIIAALIAAWPNIRDALAQWADAAWRWIVDVGWPTSLRAVQQWTAQLIQWVRDQIPSWQATLAQWAAAAWRWIVDVGWPQSVQAAQRWTAQLVQWVQSQLPGWAAQLARWADTAWRWIIDVALPQAVQSIQQWAADITRQVTDDSPGWVTALSKWALAAWSWIVEVAIPQALTMLGRWAADIAGFLISNLPGFIATLLRWATALVSWIGEAIPKALEAFTRFIQGVNDKGTKDGGKSFGDMVAKWVGIFIDWIVNDLVPLVGPAMGALLQAIVKAILAMGLELIRMGATIAVSIITGIVEALAKAVGLDISLSEFRDNIMRTLNGFIDMLKGVGGLMIEGLGKGMMEQLEKVRSGFLSKVGEFVQFIKNVLGIHSPSKVFAEIGANMMFGMEEGIMRNVSLPARAMTSAAQGAVTQASSVTNNFNLNYTTRQSTGSAAQDVQVLSALYGTGMAA